MAEREWAANGSLTEVHLFRVADRGRYWGRSLCRRVRLYGEPGWSIREDEADARRIARDHASYRPLPICGDCSAASDEGHAGAMCWCGRDHRFTLADVEIRREG